MKKRKLAFLIGFAAAFLVGQSAWAGAKLKIDDESYLDLGFRVQALSKYTDVDLDGDGSWDSDTDFQVRRARFRLLLSVNKYVSAFIQTDATDDTGGAGSDMRVIDSWVSLKYNNWLQLFSGEHMSPASRQNLTGSGALMTIDRPGNNNKTLTWGTRSVMRFQTSTYGDSSGGLSGDNAVRDVGATIFGSGSFSDTLHLKYYVGGYDGTQNATTDDDNLRWTGRAQLNFFDAEPGYFNNSTYLGGKKTIALGVSYDTQSEVQDDTLGDTADYEYWTVDGFIDWPLGAGAITAEAAYSDLDLDDANAAAVRSQGDGFYVQAGYYINKWQPWVEYETWSSDDDNDLGSYDAFRIGISYFFKGHNANVKAGFERWSPDENFTGTSEDELNTFVIGLYTTY
jgi:hypothetical protein